MLSFKNQFGGANIVTCSSGDSNNCDNETNIIPILQELGLTNIFIDVQNIDQYIEKLQLNFTSIEFMEIALRPLLPLLPYINEIEN